MMRDADEKFLSRSFSLWYAEDWLSKNEINESTILVHAYYRLLYMFRDIIKISNIIYSKIYSQSISHHNVERIQG